MIRTFFKEAPYVAGIFGVLLGFLLLLLVDGLALTTVQHRGVVLDKHYEAERSGLGTGTAITSDGEVGIVTTTESEPEQFVLMIRTEDQRVITLKCTPELFYQKDVGDAMVYAVHRGLFTGWVWSVEPVVE